MKKSILITLLSLSAIAQLSGCNYARYQTADISKNPSLAHLDSNSIPFYKVKLEYQDKEIETTIESGVKNKELKNFINEIKASSKQEITNDDLEIVGFYYSGIKSIELPENKIFSVPCKRNSMNPAAVSIPVEFPNGRKYLAYLDTGCECPIYLTSDIILKNKLSIKPFVSKDENSKSNTGLCHIPRFNIGSAKIIDALALYEQKQWQFRILNIPLYKSTDIILGRQFIKSFDYVMFDNVNHKAVFSKDGAFEPDNPDSWTSYNFSTLKEGVSAGTIMVDIPIASKILTIAFDSCGGDFLINKKHWQAVKNNLAVKQIVKSGFTIYDGSTFPAQKATVSELQIANKVHKNADLTLSNDENGLSILGLDYFQDTVVVLDFVNNLFWIKNY